VDGSRPDHERDERALVERVRSGDMTAFEALYLRHYAAVRRVAGAVVRDSDQIADVAQETFTRALDRLATLRDESRFRPWLLSIARHVATDHVRARSKAARGPDEDAALEVATAEPGPEELAELADLSRLVQHGMAELSERDATVVALVAHFGFTTSEVAAALGLSPGAAKVAVHRARRRLRDALVAQLTAEVDGFAAQSAPVLGPPAGS
jgi:RNA polymerase sigma-70 factor (ECF subfamily)